MTAETRQFDDNLPGVPLPDNSFRLEYGYQLAGGLKFYKDPDGQQIDQFYDKTGRVESVSGTSFGDNTTGEYLDDIKYRAFGAIKQMTYKTDDNALVSMQYDAALRVSQHHPGGSKTKPNSFMTATGDRSRLSSAKDAPTLRRSRRPLPARNIRSGRRCWAIRLRSGEGQARKPGPRCSPAEQSSPNRSATAPTTKK